MPTPTRIVISGDVPYDQRIQSFLDAARSRAENGFTLAEIGRTFLDFLIMAVDTARELLNEGADKKQFVLDGTARLFDYLWPAIPLPAGFLLKPLLKSTIKQIVLLVANGAIEAIYAYLQRKVPAPE